MDDQRSPSLVEEDEVEREAHPEGVDAGAAGDQQTGAGPLDTEEGESKQTGTEANRHGDLVAEDRAARQAVEAGSDPWALHRHSTP